MPALNSNRLRVGLVGCGDISGVYIDNAERLGAYEIVAVVDLDESRAEVAAERAGCDTATVEGLLADPAVNVVLNLTPPRAHASVSEAALQAGKHVYSEKPIAVELGRARSLLELADVSGLLISCAPDTVLGAGYSTARRLVREGAIGLVTSGVAFMLSSGPESWHPNPEVFFADGAGPLLDMGPYCLSALVSLLGPISAVTAITGCAHETRVVGSGPKEGKRFDVQTPTHVSAAYEFVSGAIITLVVSFDVGRHTLPHIQLFGTDGSIALPDPNTFGGPVRVCAKADDVWTEIELDPGYKDNARGLGLVELGAALRADRPRLATGATGAHVLDAMLATLRAGESGERQKVDALSIG